MLGATKLNTELRVGARYYGDIDLHIASASDNDQTQVRQINHFIDEGVDLLIISPNQMSTICPAIERARKKGIPVVLFDRKPTPTTTRPTWEPTTMASVA